MDVVSEKLIGTPKKDVPSLSGARSSSSVFTIYGELGQGYIVTVDFDRSTVSGTGGALSTWWRFHTCVNRSIVEGDSLACDRDWTCIE